MTFLVSSLIMQSTKYHFTIRNAMTTLSSLSHQSTAPAAAGASESDKTSVFERAFAVLEYVVRAGYPVTASDVADHLGLPKPTVYRMIENFEAQGFLRRDLSRRLAIGPRLADFAFETLRASIRYAPRRTILNNLVDEVGETANIGSLEGGDVVYLDRVEAEHWSLRLNFHIGSRVPLHCTAIGKLFMAYMPERQLDALLAQLDLRSFTPQTITSAKALREQLVTVREEGIALDDEEYIPGVVCIAAPIFNVKGEMQAGVAIQSPSARMSPKDALRHSMPLRRAAKALADSFLWDK